MLECHCKTKRKEYSEEFDAYYCSDCDAWLETKCEDPDCFYCPGRPERPRMMKV